MGEKKEGRTKVSCVSRSSTPMVAENGGDAAMMAAGEMAAEEMLAMARRKRGAD